MLAGLVAAAVLLTGLLYVMEPVPLDSEFVLAVPFGIAILLGVLLIIRRRRVFGVSLLVGTVVWPLLVLWGWSREPFP